MKHNYKPVICSLAITKAEKFIFSKSKANFILAFLFTILGFTDVFGQVTDTYTTTGAGTWIAPCGVTSVTVEAWGAGGSDRSGILLFNYSKIK